MKITFRILFALGIISFALSSCEEENDPNTADGPKLVFRYKLDPDQVRMGNLGQPVEVPAGNAGQNPSFNGISAHYIELAPGMFTALGTGTIVYHQAETTAGGQNAIDHTKAVVKNDGEVFFEIPLKDVNPGTFEWLRVSLAYQNYDIVMRIDTTIAGFAVNGNFTGTIASFVGFRTYLSNYNIKNHNEVVNGNVNQGYWGFEGIYYGYSSVQTGTAPVTTVPNPLFNTSPIPNGSCVVTGEFPEALVITGNETEDIIVEVSLSINKSFEWRDLTPNGLYEPLKGEYVVDMGLRGMIPRVVN